MGKKRSQNDTKANEPPQKVSKLDKHTMTIDLLHSEKHAYEALKSIADSNDNSEIIELLSQGGSGKDLLNIIDNSVEKLKAPEISLVFNACEAFLLHISSCISDASTEEEVANLKKLGIELVREILEDHIGLVYFVICNPNTGCAKANLDTLNGSCFQDFDFLINLISFL